jgi:4-hydroxy-4-methyl-2-oxoglutarate aldolase
MHYAQLIIDYCMENRVSTTEVADVLGKSGVIPHMTAVTSDLYRVGRVRPVFAAGISNYLVHEQIRDVQKGEVVIIFTYDCEERAIIGELIAKYILLYRGAVAVIVKGLVRDGAALRRYRYAVWSEGFSPLGCFNAKNGDFPVDLEKEIRAQYEGGIAVCDDGGVTVIPPNMVNEHTYNQLHKIEVQEDIWFFCLDTLKWDTKKIVCDKAYLFEQDLLSLKHIEQLRDLDSK